MCRKRPGRILMVKLMQLSERPIMLRKYSSADDLYVAATHGAVDRIATLCRDMGHDPNRSDQYG